MRNRCCPMYRRANGRKSICRLTRRMISIPTSCASRAGRSVPGIGGTAGERILSDGQMDARNGHPVGNSLQPGETCGRALSVGTTAAALSIPKTAAAVWSRCGMASSRARALQCALKPLPARILIDDRGRVTGLGRRDTRRKEHDRLQGIGFGQRRLFREPCHARAVPRRRLGSGESARHEIQHRRRHPDGAGHRRPTVRPLERRPRDADRRGRGRL